MGTVKTETSVYNFFSLQERQIPALFLYIWEADSHIDQVWHIL